MAMINNTKDRGWDVDNMGSYAYKLYLADFLREQLMRSAIRTLKFPEGSRGLDAGCGIGSITFMLLEAVGSIGHVTGIDLSLELLAHAKRRAKKSGLSEQVTFQEGDVSKLSFGDNTFDWAWSVDCVGFIPHDPLALVKELKRVVKPGGNVAILFWSSQQLLPGYPLLEARLNATSKGIAPFTKGKNPELHFLRALGWLRDAGLKELRAKTFAGDVHAPLSDDVRKAMISLFDMRWDDVESELSKEDWKTYQCLSQPDASEFILNCLDYYAFFTYSMFSGRV